MYAEFEVHMLNDAGKEKANAIAGNFSSLLGGIEAFGVDGRDLAIVKTKLEEACFFAKKGIATKPENQQ